MRQGIKDRVDITKLCLAKFNLLGKLHASGLGFVILFVIDLCVCRRRQTVIQCHRASAKSAVLAIVAVIGQGRFTHSAREQIEIACDEVGVFFVFLAALTVGKLAGEGKVEYKLRREDEHGSMYNLVGFQTHLAFPEQKRVFSMIPGLENAEFLRYGIMHRNTYLNSPGLLGADYSLLSRPGVYFAGQMTGVEGYVESIASGLVVGLNMYRYLKGQNEILFDKHTLIGALCKYVAYKTGEFQPMSANMGLINYNEFKIKDKKEKNKILAEKSLKFINEIKEKI